MKVPAPSSAPRVQDKGVGGADFEDISDLLGGFGNLGDIFGRATRHPENPSEKAKI